VLDILVQKRRDADAAKRIFRKLLADRTDAPRVIVTDKLKSYAVAKRELLPTVEHRQSRYLNNRAEVSHHRHDEGSDRCSVSSRDAKHSVSYPPIAGFIATSSFAAISSLQPNTARSGGLHSAFGAMSPALPRLHDLANEPASRLATTNSLTTSVEVLISCCVFLQQFRVPLVFCEQ
jgi:hypothetical protein